MTIRMYDLRGARHELRFSPYCWRAKMALKHKGVDFETVPWTYTDKAILAPTGQGRVPVIVDGDRWVNDSWQIALYLDERYPDRPMLMKDEAARAHARFIAQWADTNVLPALRPILFMDVHNQIEDTQRAYFRKAREEMIGMTLEAFCADRAGARARLAQALQPAELTLAEHAFLGGGAPSYADHALFGSLAWGHYVSAEPIHDPKTAVGQWFERMLDLFDGYARKAPTARD
ncbi:MAG: glutathione S-transferase family protein [Hyphomicrobiaceae bacterium]|nr:glutathione S-transferase family protein [Hyphomicrobiaceae bacterium]